MNQKLRTARSGIVILLVTILCIVCLSLSLALSAHFAAFADGDENTITELPVRDSKGNDLWLVHRVDSNGDALLDDNDNPIIDVLGNGTDGDGMPISYLSTNGDDIAYGTLDDVNCFVEFRGVDVYYTIELNPAYEIDGQPLSVLYDLSADIYGGSNKVVGSETYSVAFRTTVDAAAVIKDGGKALKLIKDWMVITRCNTVDIPDNYIGATRSFAEKSNIELLKPVMGDAIVYEILKNNKSDDGAITTETVEIIVVRYENNGSAIAYYRATANGSSYNINEHFDDSIVNTANGADFGNLVNYMIRSLGVGSYSLKVTAMSPSNVDGESSDIYYAASSKYIDFEIVAQDISGDNFDKIFDANPQDKLPASVEYTGNDLWLPEIELSIGGVVLSRENFFLQTSSVDVGMSSVTIVAADGGNLSGSYTLTKLVPITPAINDWDVLPNINPWSYGAYDPNVNKIVGMTKYLENINDITFRVVKLSKDRENNTVENEIAGLNAIHFVEVQENDTVKYAISDDVAKLLAGLRVGDYRLCVSVYGVNLGDNVSDPELKRNYRPMSERSIDFAIVQGVNSWDSENGVPSIVSWTAGKYDPEKNIITAVDKFGNNAIVVIKNGKGEIVYSNSPIHAGQDYSDIKVLKNFKAGYYTLQAQIKETADYGGLDTLIDFEIARNGLPAWAVIIIVAGALGIVALVFGLLHQKGVLQMLTGKVIISMRTRANVDATLAAIRAAKVAREAEESIAAAKAREAEEAAKSKKDENK